MRNDILWVLDDRGVFTLFEGNRVFETGQLSERLIGKNIFTVFKSHPDAIEVAKRGLAGISTGAKVDFGGMVWKIKGFPLRNETGVISGVVGVANAVTDQKLYEFKQQSVLGCIKALREAVNYNQMKPIILEQTKQLFNPVGIALTSCVDDSGKIVVESTRGIWTSLRVGNVLSEHVPWLHDQSDVFISSSGVPEELKTDNDLSIIGIRLIVKYDQIGILWIAKEEQVRDEDIQLLANYGEIVANAINKAKNYERTQIRLKRLSALHEIDRAITNNTNLSITFNIILYHVLEQLEVDAAVILLMNPESNRMEYAYSRGLPSNRIKLVSIPISDCLVNQNSFENTAICVKNRQDGNPCEISILGQEEGFPSHFCSPLVIRGQIIGILGLFKQTPSKPEIEWYSFLETITTQAAIAVDNAALFNDLQVTNKELAMAYETTLEGWVRALDLRDRETEGHTKRVANMTLVLSQALGIEDSALPHVRRGALLHDIGKMGVSDRILNKIGPLTDEEWDIMKRHPIYAKNLLSPITFLHQAIDIPYYHHEKWDGTGYPQGLAGAAIPLTARIFSVVDVWDALTSDRPYRAAWPIEKAKTYLISESGKHFDPRIVKKFFELGLDSSHK